MKLLAMLVCIFLLCSIAGSTLLFKKKLLLAPFIGKLILKKKLLLPLLKFGKVFSQGTPLVFGSASSGGGYDQTYGGYDGGFSYTGNSGYQSSYGSGSSSHGNGGSSHGYGGGSGGGHGGYGSYGRSSHAPASSYGHRADSGWNNNGGYQHIQPATTYGDTSSWSYSRHR